MAATWARIAGMGLLLLAVGCKTPQPDLRPPKMAEALNAPPAERRFDVASYPKEAFNNRDPLKGLNGQELTPVRGPSSPTSMGSPGMMR
jgi:hypothetical protein